MTPTAHCPTCGCPTPGDHPQGKPTPAELRRIKRAITDAVDGRPSLNDFLTRVKGLHPDIDEATEGIYTGAEGSVALPISDWNHRLCFNWYSNDVRKHFVEWAYLS